MSAAQLELWDDRPPHQQRRDELRRAVFVHYGESCACCGATDGLTIDHLDGGGGEHRRELFGEQTGGVRVYAWLVREGFPPGYGVLCHPCNRSKGRGARCRLNHHREAGP